MGTPIPRRSSEIIPMNNECNVYYLTPEEIAALPAAKDIPRSQTKPMAVGILTDRDRAKMEKYRRTKAKAEKDDYLALRAAGKTQVECAKELGITLISLKNHWFRKWSLNGRGIEGQAIADYIESHRT